MTYDCGFNSNKQLGAGDMAVDGGWQVIRLKFAVISDL